MEKVTEKAASTAAAKLGRYQWQDLSRRERSQRMRELSLKRWRPETEESQSKALEVIRHDQMEVGG